jgi:hypothetical protein
VEILQGVSTTIRFPAFGDDEVELSEPTVTVTRESDGSKILEEAEAEEGKAAEDEIAYWTVKVPAVSEPDRLTAEWTDDSSTYTQEVEVVGGFVCSVAAIKKKLGEQPVAAEVEAKREIATKDIESACGVAFRPRYERELVSGRGTKRLILNRREVTKVLSVKVGDSVWGPEEISGLTIDPIGILVADSPWTQGSLNVEVGYVYGYQDFASAVEPVRDYAAYLLTPAPSDWQGRATSVTNEYGSSFALVTPGVRGASFPLPSVNAFVERFETPLIR